MTDDVVRPFKVVDGGERCETCAYFFNPAKAETGLCRRHVPHVFLVGSQTDMQGKLNGIIQSAHPPMSPIGWCGEYSPRSVEQVFQREDSPVPVVEPRRFGPFGGLFHTGQKVVEPVVTSGPEKPVTDPSGGGEDGGHD